MILQTKRLLLRQMTAADLPALRGILQDAAVMYAYEGPFSDGEVEDWLNRQRQRYGSDGFGLWLALRRSDGGVVGQCGLTLQDYRNERVVEVGYLLRRDCWGQGYATEAAVACKAYAFETLGVPAVYSIIRDTNVPSARVALRNGMTPVDTVIKHYKGIDMPHIVYGVQAPRG